MGYQNMSMLQQDNLTKEQQELTLIPLWKMKIKEQIKHEIEKEMRMRIGSQFTNSNQHIQ